MEMERRGEQSISLSISRIAEMATSAVTNRGKVVKSSETERKERMDTSSLMEQILSNENLNRAYLQVVRNKGAEGVDGMKYTELKEHLVKNSEIIKEQLRTRKYVPFWVYCVTSGWKPPQMLLRRTSGRCRWRTTIAVPRY